MILFILAAFFFLCLTGILGINALMSFIQHAADTAASMNVVGAYFFQFALLFVPIYLSWRKYTAHAEADQPMRVPFQSWYIVAGLLVAALALGFGYFISGHQPFDAFFLPICTLLVVSIPIFLLFGLASKRLETGTHWRFWSIFGLGMTLGPLILIIAEIGIGLILLIGVVVYVMAVPGLTEEMLRLSSQLQNITNPELAIPLLAPYLTDPKVLALILSYVALIVPLIEELIKPIGVWLFARQIKTPAEGFALGALSGAVYGLIESLGVASNSGANWATLVAVRAGTGLLHITASGLMGWAIVSAVQEKKYLRALLAYAGAVLLHGTWNGMAILFSMSSLDIAVDGKTLSNFAMPAFGALAMLAVGMLLLLFRFNRRLQPAPTLEPDPVPEAANPPEEPPSSE